MPKLGERIWIFGWGGSVERGGADKGGEKDVGNGGGYLPALQILRAACEIHKCYMQVMFCDGILRTGLNFREELACRMEAA